MAHQRSTATKLKDGSKDKFYQFFKYHVNRLSADICPNIVKSIQLTDGTKTWEASPGNRKVIEFQSPSADGATIKVKDRVTNVLDSSRTIIYELIENGWIIGDITKVQLEVTDDDTAIWTVYYNSTNPDQYLALLKSVNEAVDNHIK